MSTALLVGGYKMICDFCNSTTPKWDYDTATYLDEKLQAKSLGNWVACEECSRLIDAEEWAKLANRSLLLCPTSTMLITLVGYEEALRETFRVHNGFRKHRVGVKRTL